MKLCDEALLKYIKFSEEKTEFTTSIMTIEDKKKLSIRGTLTDLCRFTIDKYPAIAKIAKG